jgi:hypothetical protein
MDAARAIVLARDGNTCQRCGTNLLYKLASIHHRRPRGMGGSADVNVASNMVLLCGSATTPGSCHEYAETQRGQARIEGWLIPKLSDIHPSEVPLLTFHGWRYLLDDGTWISIVGVA